MSEYPPGFHEWPLDRRVEWDAATAKSREPKGKPNGVGKRGDPGPLDLKDERLTQRWLVK